MDCSPKKYPIFNCPVLPLGVKKPFFIVFSSQINNFIAVFSLYNVSQFFLA